MATNGGYLDKELPPYAFNKATYDNVLQLQDLVDAETLSSNGRKFRFNQLRDFLKESLKPMYATLDLRLKCNKC
jgi:hypothetical protein